MFMAPVQVSGDRVEPRIGRSVSLEHAAVLLGVSRRTIYNRIREGRLLTVRTPGGSQRVLSTSMVALLAGTDERHLRTCELAPEPGRFEEGHP
jgi:excisionase family DNA binding protein